jgi:hypothetical protein
MRVVDITGQRFGRLSVIARSANTKSGKAKWECVCDCGNHIVATGVDLRNRHTQTCGCTRSESIRKVGQANLLHGHSKHGRSPSYNVWLSLRQRCYNPKHKFYRYYGGKGIQVCARWFDFENFLTDMGQPPKGKWIDRIDGNLHYMPSNCRWATPLEQRHNWSLKL